MTSDAAPMRLTDHRSAARADAPAPSRSAGRRGAWALVVLVAGLGVGGATATAEAAAPLRPPAVSGELKSPGLMTVLVGGLLTAAVIAVGVMPTKRGHQD